MLSKKQHFSQSLLSLFSFNCSCNLFTKSCRHPVVFLPSTHLLVHLSFGAAVKAAPKTAHKIALPFLFCTFCSCNTTLMHLTTTSGLYQFSFAYSVPKGIGKALYSLNFCKIREQSSTDISRSVLACSCLRPSQLFKNQ